MIRAYRFFRIQSPERLLGCAGKIGRFGTDGILFSPEMIHIMGKEEKCWSFGIEKAVCKFDIDEHINIFHDASTHPHTAHEAPAERCGCGIYGFKDIKWAATQAPKVTVAPFIFAEVLLWGKIIEHDEGYRAEFAQYNSLLAVYGKKSKTHEQLMEAAISRLGEPQLVPKPIICRLDGYGHRYVIREAYLQFLQRQVGNNLWEQIKEIIQSDTN